MTTPHLTGFTSTPSPRTELALGEPVAPNTVTLVAGQVVPRGAVLGRITASGKYALSMAAAGDGSQTPVAIAAEDTSAAGGDVACLVYERGDFLDTALTLGAGHTVASIRPGLRTLGITLIPVGPLA